MRNQDLISTLGNCINHCNYCADACLEEDNVKMMVNCIRTDRVCAEVCSTLSQVLATNYENINGLVKYCIEICEACATECEGHEHKHCVDCAAACRKCAAVCKEYLA
ncbi:four-helix bundle copper-binding protein [Dokdonia sp. Hel_I_53]|uniref:four-helix bundle copper-binding protein n=1 Tax=Dokdonia sp. Hel_I_53 TaxID=1566287 RepID=UPI00119AB876|nr:four-helix bundle copper-binding protein [Dokdonia sp. Hel_I_53]TVZ53094.1 uncharacterized protein DUF326 [Dokdonia sp. Hel_I_53]